jgi:hypothetical protein
MVIPGPTEAPCLPAESFTLLVIKIMSAIGEEALMKSKA